MECQYHNRRMSKGICKECKPKIIFISVESYPVTQVAIEVSMNGNVFRGYLPIAKEEVR